MLAFVVHLFGYITFSFMKLRLDELKMVVKEYQLPMLLILTYIKSEAQKHAIGVFPSVEGDETAHVVDGTYSKYITIAFISDALDWYCGDGCKLSHAHDVFCSCTIKKQEEKYNRKVYVKKTSIPLYEIPSKI